MGDSLPTSQSTLKLEPDRETNDVDSGKRSYFSLISCGRFTFSGTSWSRTLHSKCNTPHPSSPGRPSSSLTKTLDGRMKRSSDYADGPPCEKMPDPTPECTRVEDHQGALVFPCHPRSASQVKASDETNGSETTTHRILTSSAATFKTDAEYCDTNVKLP
ncbi:hypothetical protein EDB83DRAFT_2344258 [Lactarius deliciosus]|nr:hypothetical protein EDB83DRAFT_2344258 [Lactarius deliciosus]